MLGTIGSFNCNGYSNGTSYKTIFIICRLAPTTSLTVYTILLLIGHSGMYIQVSYRAALNE